MLKSLKNCHLDINFNYQNLLGKGAYAKVYKGTISATNKAYKNHDNNSETVSNKMNLKTINFKRPTAIKIFNKKQIFERPDRENFIYLIQNETEILEILSKNFHQNIANLYYYCEDLSNIFLSMQFCNASDLARFLRKRDNLAVSEKCARVIMKQLSSAMAVLDKCGVIHRDIKPENLMLHRIDISHHDDANTALNIEMPVTVNDIMSGRAIIKLTDFGLAKFTKNLPKNEKVNSIAGSPIYMAPEIMARLSYSANADLWSIGVLFYQLVTSHYPFTAKTPGALREHYLNCFLLLKNGADISLSFPSQEDIRRPMEFGNLSKEEQHDSQAIGILSNDFKDFVLNLLHIDPNKRLSMEDYLNHSYLMSVEDGEMMTTPITNPILERQSTIDQVRDLSTDFREKVSVI